MTGMEDDRIRAYVDVTTVYSEHTRTARDHHRYSAVYSVFLGMDMSKQICAAQSIWTHSVRIHEVEHLAQSLFLHGDVGNEDRGVRIRRCLALPDLHAVLAKHVLLHQDELPLPLQALHRPVERDVHLHVAEVDNERVVLRITELALLANQIEHLCHVHPARTTYIRRGFSFHDITESIQTYAWIVVETCPGSLAALAIRIRRNKGGPWLDEGPSELGNMPREEPSDPRPALVPANVSSGARLVVTFGALRRPVDFFLPTTRDILRCIFDSKTLFCWTVMQTGNG